MSTTTTVYSSSNDGHMYAGTDGHFSVARDAASADSIDASSTVARIGLDTLYSPDKYGFYRIGLAFDTSSIPDGATILSATLSLYLVYGLTIIPGGFQFVLMKMADNDGTYPHNPLVVGDYDRTHYVSGGASSPTIISGAGGYQAFVFNSTGCASWINDQGLSKFVVMTSLDIGYVVPNPGMLISVYTQERGAGYLPKLAITYATPCTVTTQAATSVLASGATGNGNVTDGGGETVNARGVIWNDDGSDPVDLASADNSASGGSGTGAFTATISGCAAETSYYYRAYATTVAGSSYGSAVQFTTTADSTILTVTTQAASAVAVTTATLNGTVVEDAGHDLTAYGFIYKKGGDPGTPADPSAETTWTATDKGGKASPAEGAFSSDIVSLDGDSSYFFRAYVTTVEDGTAYGGVELARTGTAANTVIDGDTGDGSLYTYDIWAYGGSCESGSGACEDDTTASIGSSGGYSYPDRVVLLTNETEFQLKADCFRVGAYWNCGLQRAFLYFDTSALSGKTIISVTLGLYVTYSAWYDMYTNYFSQGLKVMHDSSGTYPSESGGSPALEVGDFDKTHYSEIAAMSEADMDDAGGPGAINAYMEVAIPIAKINKDGLTKLCIMLDDPGEFASYSSTGQVKFQSADGANEPYLDIDYAESPAFVLPKANIGDAWVQTLAAHVNIGDAWVELETPLANLGDDWVEPTG